MMPDLTFTIPSETRLAPFLREFDMGEVLMNETPLGDWLAGLEWVPEATYVMSVRRIIETSWDGEGANVIAMLDDVHEREGLPPIQTEKKPMGEKQDAVPERDRMLKWFDYEHLIGGTREMSRPFAGLADAIVNTLKPGPERTVALRKLLEAKDAAVRAIMHPGG